MLKVVSHNPICPLIFIINSWSGHEPGWTLREECRLHRVWIKFVVEDT